MVDEKILDKVQKLLAYARSATTADATAFLTKAQALMAEHNLTEGHLELAQVGHVDIRSQASVSKMKPYENNLMHLVAKAFGCRVLWTKSRSHHHDTWGRYSLVGAKSQLPVAEYTAQVLLRKLLNARSEFVATLPYALDRAAKTAEADGFSVGWVRAVARTVHAFASQVPARAIEVYMKEHLGVDLTKDKVEAQARVLGDLGYEAGRRAGALESLHRPMTGEAAAAKQVGGPAPLRIGQG